MGGGAHDETGAGEHEGGSGPIHLHGPRLAAWWVSKRNNHHREHAERQVSGEVYRLLLLDGHSLADYLRKQGLGIYDISKVLAHADVKISERYLRGFDREDLDVDILPALKGEATKRG